ncbi:unnamed protein product [Meloidogyne enterolobii]|uniref:Uncharacterized protein n=1 Tax=Meloidogyne enterolobii TaxID=390850 RepID=A0ACB0Z349_MELEN
MFFWQLEGELYFVFWEGIWGEICLVFLLLVFVCLLSLCLPLKLKKLIFNKSRKIEKKEN